jgi:hypothetical protein
VIQLYTSISSKERLSCNLKNLEFLDELIIEKIVYLPKKQEDWNQDIFECLQNNFIVRNQSIANSKDESLEEISQRYPNIPIILLSI